MNDLEDQAKMDKKRSNKVLKEKTEEKSEKIEKKAEALEEVEEDNKMVVEAWGQDWIISFCKIAVEVLISSYTLFKNNYMTCLTLTW